ncbi:HAD family hydrolase [Falsiroseomonas selenitidurans]|uniref:phosphoglycolate phosphatase n=1 Tax=Falsiroseomonas selenitidurans TaxID=2716335 RepID=A0ABX1E3C4_9PROT|nr:HAD family hydrolase [Falsiroseomonas selenitidurans]NKC30267.1 HAD family hydrolase [Falsiroseomonas selenitidurans]
MQRPDCILWDWDNTLVDGWAAIQHGLNATFAEFGMPLWNRETVLANVRGSLRDTFPGMFGAEWERARDLFYGAVRSCHLDVLSPMPGALSAIRAAAPLGPQGVVSNKQGPLLRAEAAHLGWAGHFATLVGAGDASADKPSAAPLLMALAACGIQAGPAVWYVGDTVLDMDAARAAGCTAVLLGRAAHDGGVEAARPDLVFDDGHALAAGLQDLARAGVGGGC